MTTQINFFDEILKMAHKKSANYDHSKIRFSVIMKRLNCTEEELAYFLNGCQDARIYNRIEYDVD